MKKENKEAAGTESAVSDAEVMGSTRYVYLDENAGKTATPFMSQPLERNFIGEEEDVQQEDVECNLQLDKMKLLQNLWKDCARQVFNDMEFVCDSMLSAIP